MNTTNTMQNTPSHKLITETFTPKKSSIISHVEYSYFLNEDGVTRMTERIMLYFLPHVSFGFLQVEYFLGKENFDSLKKEESIAKYWYKNIKNNQNIKFNIIKRK